jgi:hypothetical protein
MANKYQPMTGISAGILLNSLGYEIRGDDNADMSVLGMIVALAKQIAELKAEIENIRNKREAK